MSGGSYGKGLMTRINDGLKTFKGKVAGAVLGAGLGLLAAVSPVQADQLYDYNKSDYVAERYMEENFPDYVERDVFRTVHELMSEKDSKAEYFVETEDVEYYLDRFSSMADRHGDYDSSLDRDEVRETSRDMRKILPFFADFWMGDMDGRPEEGELKQFKKGVGQHESLIAARIVADGDYESENYLCGDEELENYMENNIHGRDKRKVFYRTEDLFERFEEFEPENKRDKREARNSIREYLDDLAMEIGGSNLVDKDEPTGKSRERLADIYGHIRPEMKDYLVGDGDGVVEYWETRKYDDMKQDNIVINTVETFIDYYGE